MVSKVDLPPDGQQKNRTTRLGDFVMSALIPVALGLLLLGQDPATPAPSELSREEMQFLKETVTGLKLYEPANVTKPVAVTGNPVLGPYNNTTGPSRFGATFLWLSGERPVGVASISIRRSPSNPV